LSGGTLAEVLGDVADAERAVRGLAQVDQADGTHRGAARCDRAQRHTALALRNGVDLAALRQTLDSGSLSADRTPEEVAILYAQHVASEQGDADPGAERALAAAWTPAEQAEIKAYITAITFGNLVGNSVDAWLARLRRVPVEGGHPAGEAIAALPGLPALLSAWAWSRTRGSAVIDSPTGTSGTRLSQPARGVTGDKVGPGAGTNARGLRPSGLSAGGEPGPGALSDQVREAATGSWRRGLPVAGAVPAIFMRRR